MEPDEEDDALAEASSGPVEEDELALFEAYRANQSTELHEKLVMRYSRLVVSLVRKFRGRAEWEDLVQVGYLGLLKAVSAFNVSSGNRFSTYASHCILGELRHYLRDRAETVRKPRWLQSLSRKVGGFVEAFLQANQRLPTVGEISEGCNLARDSVIEVLKAGAIVSLEQMQGENAGSSPQVGKIRSLREESFVLSLEDRVWLDSALERLLEVERHIVKMFFFRDLNQNQIAGETGLPPKRVSRIIRRALNRLQVVMRLGSKEGDDNDGGR